MSHRGGFLLTTGPVALAALLIVESVRVFSVSPARPGARTSAERPVRLGGAVAIAMPERGARSIAAAPPTGNDSRHTAIEELAMRDPAAALAEALAPANQDMRRSLLAAALRGWARVNLVAAGNWAQSQTWLEPNEAFAAVFSGAVSHPEEAMQYARELGRTYTMETGSCGDALVTALCDAGKYEQASQFGAEDATAPTARMTTIYRRWAQRSPESAWSSALALNDGVVRIAALEGAVHIWSQIDPQAVAELARQLPVGPERTMALTMVLRAWLDEDLDGAAAWLQRWEPTGTLAAVNLAAVLE